MPLMGLIKLHRFFSRIRVILGNPEITQAFKNMAKAYEEMEPVLFTFGLRTVPTDSLWRTCFHNSTPI